MGIWQVLGKTTPWDGVAILGHLTTGLKSKKKKKKKGKNVKQLLKINN